jgi:hypothetical protein
VNGKSQKKLGKGKKGGKKGKSLTKVYLESKLNPK